METCLVYGIRDGSVVHIDDVQSGIACGCACPECGERLVARKGRVRAWHFAHESGADCATAPETALHKMAKQFILDAGAVILPAVRGNVSDWYVHAPILSPSEFVKASEIGSEAAFDDVVPDIWIKDGAGRVFFVEILVTHAVGDGKADKLRKLGVPTVEADFSDVPRDIPPADFAKCAVRRFAGAGWAWHPLMDAWDAACHQDRLDMLSPLERLKYEARCPVCFGAVHEGCYDDEGTYACEVCGRQFVLDENAVRFTPFDPGPVYCPKCGRLMIERVSWNGHRFLGCTGYPRFCRHTASIF